VKKLTAIPVIETPRLRCRVPAMTDAPAFFELHSDPETLRYWSSTPMREMREAEERVAKLAGYLADGTGYAWAIERREDARVIGTLSLHRLDEQNERAEVGYLLGRAYWGRGYMQEALGALLQYAFEELEVRRIEADTDPRNQGSVRTLERAGFTREGLLRERWVVAGEISDTAFFGLLRREWRERTGRQA
jgi:ribosomal-protein-alanine N-acetyltransferase